MRQIQATGNINGKTVTVKQISKTEAKKLFADGKEVYLQSSNMHPFGMWQSVCPIKLDSEQLQADIKHNQFCINLYTEQVNKFKNTNEDWSNNLIPDYEAKVKKYNQNVINAFTQFDSVCNNYGYYNLDSERGRYINYYKTI